MSSAAAVIERCAELGLRLAIAESLTGGMLCATLVGVPGASRVVSGGVIAYDTAIKASLLGVSQERLSAYGPVDAEVAKQMAAGVRRTCAVAGVPAQLGISTTGVAGPDPDPQTGQPVGTVWVGLSLGEMTKAILVDVAPGSRQQIREATVIAAINAAQELLTHPDFSS